MDRPAWGWREVLISVVLMMPAMIGASIAVLVAFWLIQGQAPNPIQLAMPAQILSYAVWLAGIWMLFRLKNLSVWREYGCFWPGLSSSLFYLAMGPPLALLTGLVAGLLGARDAEMSLIKQLLADPAARLQLIAFGITVGPFVEELLFRGALLPVLLRHMNKIAALVVTSLPFALMHGPMYSWSWQHLLLLVAVGASFGLVRLHSGSTLASTLTHSAYNLTMFAGYFITKHGGNN